MHRIMKKYITQNINFIGDSFYLYRMSFDELIIYWNVSKK
jgi:hypothetical protein